MSRIVDTATAFFAGQRWPWRRIEQPAAIEVSSIGPEPRWKNYAQAKQGERVFVYYSVCPRKVPEERRATVASFLCHVNFGLLVGAWEMDMDDGEVRFRTSLDVEYEAISQQAIARIVIHNHDVMLTWLSPLLDVIDGAQTPQAAYQAGRESESD